MGVAVWVRVLLPQILGAPLPAAAAAGSPAQRSVPRLGAEGVDKSLGFLDALLRQGRPPAEAPDLDERGLPRWHPGTVGLAPADSRLVRMPAPPVGCCTRAQPEPVVPHSCVHASLRQAA